MKKNSIISILINDENVNLYTKLLIFLYYRNKDNKNEINDKLIAKYLKLDIEKDKKNIYKNLKKLENNKIIKIEIKKRRRYFYWNIEEEKEEISKEYLINKLLDFDWLNM